MVFKLLISFVFVASVSASCPGLLSKGQSEESDSFCEIPQKEDDSVWSEVRRQYEQFPQPEMSPDALERERVWYSTHGNTSVHREHFHETLTLEVLSHFLFKGGQPYSPNFRCLVVGDGTGSSTLFLAQQLSVLGGQVVYLDISTEALKVARGRASTRGLSNIRWERGDLMELHNMDLGTFNFIEAKGVLSHVDDHKKGLELLSSLLAPGGGMSLMMYSKYARTGVYQMQELMRLVNRNSKTVEEEISNTRKILKILPENNWYKREELNQEEAYGEYRLGSRRHHINMAYSDSEINDIFLSKLDKGVSLPELHALVSEAGLHFVDYALWSTRLGLQLHNHIKHEEMLTMLLKKDRLKRDAIGELIIGYLSQLHLFVSKEKEAEASFADLGAVPFMYGNTRKLGKRLAEAWKFRRAENFTLKLKVRSELYLEGSRIKHGLDWPLNKFNKYFLDEVMGGEGYTIAELLERGLEEFKGEIGRAELLQEWREVYEAAKRSGQMLLRVDRDSHRRNTVTEHTKLYTVYEEEREQQIIQ